MATKSPCDSGLDPLNAKDTMGPSRWLQRGLRMGWCCTRPASASGGCTGAGGGTCLSRAKTPEGTCGRWDIGERLTLRGFRGKKRTLSLLFFCNMTLL